jgi:alkylation response protein AidB-like acyl-CoA dehydrogenase
VGAPDRCCPARLRVRRLGRVQSIFGGTTEIQKEIIGRSLGL